MELLVKERIDNNVGVMKKVKLNDIIEFARNGAAIKQSEDANGYPISRIETIWNSTIDENRLGYANIFDKQIINFEKYLLKENDILISHINSPKHLGKSAIYIGNPEKLIHGMNLLCIRCNPKLSFPKYLFYYFQTKYFKDQILKISNQSVNQASFAVTNLKELEIPLPLLATQQKIASILDKSDELRQYNKQLIEKYDALTKSLFLEMFGDPVKNEKGWKKIELKNCTSKIGSGSTPRGGKEAYHSEGISLIRSLNIYDNEFKYKNLAFINNDQATKLKNVTVKSNDVLFNITGASVCRCTVVPNDVLPARVNQHVSILRPISDKLHSLFLSHLLISENIKIQLLGVGSAGGAIMEAITKEQLEKFNIPVPPIELQAQFAERVHMIEIQKQQAQESLAKSEDLFQGLLQRAFKGELN